MVTATIGGKDVLLGLNRLRTVGHFSIVEEKSMCILSRGDGLVTLSVGAEHVLQQRNVTIVDGVCTHLPQSKIVGVLCSVCFHISRDSSDNKRHCNSMHNKDKIVMCPRCSRVFTTVYVMKEHMRGCVYKCSACDFSDVKKVTVQSHQRRAHRYDSE